MNKVQMETLKELIQHNPRFAHYLGQHAQSRRTVLGLSVGQIALELGVGHAEYLQFEIGNMDHLSEEFLQKMVRALKIESSDLFDLFQVARIDYINQVAKSLLNNYPA